MSDFEKTLLSNLIHNEDFTRRTIPFIKEDFFRNRDEVTLFKIINAFVVKYNNLPTKEAIAIELSNNKTLTEDEYKNTKTLLNSLIHEEVEQQWLLDTTEKWCKDRAVYNAVLQGIKIIDGKDKKHTPEAIPTILSDALGVSFDRHIGHDYLAMTDERFDYYHRVEERLKFDLNYFNRITKGGLPPKTLNVALAGTGVGKSLFMCHVASSVIAQGKNVLYITCEMSEEKIAERIDANLLGVNIQEIADLPKQIFESKVSKLMKKTQGKLIIKEYPTASAHVGHFKSLLNELTLKTSFKPDLIFVDYLNICASQRFKGAVVNSYTYVKAIAEELRGLAVENNVPIISATQTTRSGYGSSDVDLTDTSESFGLPATADFMFALITTEESEQLNQILVKQLKNRYNDPTMNKRFAIGVDRSKMKLYDVEQSAQNDIIEQPPSTTVITKVSSDEVKPNVLNKFQKFKNLKV